VEDDCISSYHHYSGYPNYHAMYKYILHQSTSLDGAPSYMFKTPRQNASHQSKPTTPFVLTFQSPRHSPSTTASKDLALPCHVHFPAPPGRSEGCDYSSSSSISFSRFAKRLTRFWIAQIAHPASARTKNITNTMIAIT
jgi:hypothetical protein